MTWTVSKGKYQSSSLTNAEHSTSNFHVHFWRAMLLFSFESERQGVAIVRQYPRHLWPNAVCLWDCPLHTMHITLSTWQQPCTNKHDLQHCLLGWTETSPLSPSCYMLLNPWFVPPLYPQAIPGSPCSVWCTDHADHSGRDQQGVANRARLKLKQMPYWMESRTHTHTWILAYFWFYKS